MAQYASRSPTTGGANQLHGAVWLRKEAKFPRPAFRVAVCPTIMLKLAFPWPHQRLAVTCRTWIPSGSCCPNGRLALRVEPGRVGSSHACMGDGGKIRISLLMTTRVAPPPRLGDVRLEFGVFAFPLILARPLKREAAVSLAKRRGERRISRWRLMK